MSVALITSLEGFHATAMSERADRLVRRFFDAVNAGDEAGIDQAVARSFLSYDKHGVPSWTGRVRVGSGQRAHSADGGKVPPPPGRDPSSARRLTRSRKRNGPYDAFGTAVESNRRHHSLPLASACGSSCGLSWGASQPAYSCSRSRPIAGHIAVNPRRRVSRTLARP